MFRYRKNGFKWGLALLFCLFQTCVTAQSDTDTAKQQVSDSFIGADSSITHRAVICYILTGQLPNATANGEPDTGVTGAYRQESLLRARDIYNTLSTIGQAHKSLNYNPEQSFGFRYKELPYPCYRRELERWPLYKVDGVYTNIRYEWRNGQENSFDVEHAQQVGNFRYNMAFQTRRSEGVYVNEGVRDINVGFQGLFRSDSSRYGMDISYIYNLFHLHESGGIANDADYLANLEPRAISVNTPNAINHYNDNDFRFRHWFHPGNSRDSGNILLPSRLGYVTHQFQLKNFRSKYNDDAFNTSLFPNPYFDSGMTKDSVSGKEIFNQIGWTNREPSSISDNGFLVFAGLSHTYIRTGDTLKSFNSNVCALNAALDLPLKKAGIWQNRFSYAFSGYNRNDVNFRSGYTLPLQRFNQDSTLQTGLIRLSLHYSLSEPDYFFRHYASNYFCWDRSLDKRHLLQAEGLLDWRGWQAAFRSFTLGNHVYLDEQLQVCQSAQPIQVLQGELLLPIRWRGFGTNLHAYLQHSSSEALHLPALVTRNSLFYGFPLFHQAAYVQFGVEVTYFTAYYADGYQASMQQFYNQSSTLIGNDFYLSAFLNARIEHFHAYFACANILSAMEGFYPFQFPHYPAKGLNFRFGISWRFYD